MSDVRLAAMIAWTYDTPTLNQTRTTGVLIANYGNLLPMKEAAHSA
jgi:hypothetical protein